MTATELLFRADPYLHEAEAHVVAHTPEGGIVLDRTVFYPTVAASRRQRRAALGWRAAGHRHLCQGRRRRRGACACRTRRDAACRGQRPAGLDWERRHRHMRVHTALHLLSVVIPLPVTGGQIGAERGRLDFDMPDPPENIERIEEALNRLIDLDLRVTETWITDDELAANPGLVKTMSVKPPVGQGRVRLVRIGEGTGQVDLQPCGGTHVARTAEIGRVEIDKVEKKGRQNRRISVTWQVRAISRNLRDSHATACVTLRRV